MNIITVYLEQSDLDHLLYTPFPSKSKCVCARTRARAPARAEFSGPSSLPRYYL